MKRDPLLPTDEAMRRAEAVLRLGTTVRSWAKAWVFFVGFVFGLTAATFVWVWVCV